MQACFWIVIYYHFYSTQTIQTIQWILPMNIWCCSSSKTQTISVTGTATARSFNVSDSALCPSNIFSFSPIQHDHYGMAAKPLWVLEKKKNFNLQPYFNLVSQKVEVRYCIWSSFSFPKPTLTYQLQLKTQAWKPAVSY